MVVNEFRLMPAGACMFVSTSAEDTVRCAHCREDIPLRRVEAEPGCLSVACPHCEGSSLLVRLVSVLHQAIGLPGRLLTQLRPGEIQPLVFGPPVRMPDQVFTLSVPKGAVVLLAMLWHRAERIGVTTIESSISRLAQRLLTSRSVIRRWLRELEEVEALRALGPLEGSRGARRWELLPLSETEVDDG